MQFLNISCLFFISISVGSKSLKEICERGVVAVSKNLEKYEKSKEIPITDVMKDLGRLQVRFINRLKLLDINNRGELVKFFSLWSNNFVKENLEKIKNKTISEQEGINNIIKILYIQLGDFLDTIEDREVVLFIEAIRFILFNLVDFFTSIKQLKQFVRNFLEMFCYITDLFFVEEKILISGNNFSYNKRESNCYIL